MSENEIRIRDLSTEVSALKGELEQQAANHSRDMNDRLSTAESIAQEANLEFASQARGIHVMREKHLHEKQDLERKLSRTLLDQIKKRKGTFYDDVSAALKSTMAEEGVVRARQLQQQVEALEEQLLHAKGEQRTALEGQKQALVQLHAQEMEQATVLFHARLDQRLASLTEEHQAAMQKKDNASSLAHR